MTIKIHKDRTIVAEFRKVKAVSVDMFQCIEIVLNTNARIHLGKYSSIKTLETNYDWFEVEEE